MSHYVEARAEKRHDRKRGRREIRILTNDAEDRHVIRHYYDDGSMDHFEFAHPHENDMALMHIAEHAGMEPPEDDQDQGGDQEGES